jgi:hypothetical protein
MLAAIASITAMAFIGASGASATPPWLGSCLAQELLNCKNLVKHPLPGRFLLLASAGEFKSPNITVKCTEGMGSTKTLGGEETEQSGGFKATLEELKFSGCTGCSVAVVVPQATTLSMTTEATESWVLTANGAKVKFTNCLGLGINCTFGGNLTFNVKMDATSAYADPEGKEFTLTEGSESLCGKVGKWESGRTRLDWQLDDAEPIQNGTRHPVWQSLIGPKLIPVP